MTKKRAWSLVAVLVAISLVVVGSQLWALSQSRLGGFDSPLSVPPIAESTMKGSVRTFDLNLQAGSTEFEAGNPVETWGINGDYLAPTIRVADGEEIKINVGNGLPEDTTLHWHGLHVPAMMDGGPHQPIEMGATWNPHWTVSQAASTNWYHPHLHGRSEAHVKLGVVGKARWPPLKLIERPNSSSASTSDCSVFPATLTLAGIAVSAITGSVSA